MTALISCEWRELFSLGMKRDIGIPTLPKPGSSDVVLELGPGHNPIPGAVGFSLPEWDADHEGIPVNSNTVDFIHAYHFFEHVTDVVGVLMECQRVLRPNGVLSVGVPYGASPLALQDVTHKHFFVLDTWKTLLRNAYYTPMPGAMPKPVDWRMIVTLNVVMAVADANPMLFTQFIRTT